MNFNVKYRKHDGTEVTTTVRAERAAGYAGPMYYAIALATMGCGKTVMGPMNAVRTLVRDHGTIIRIWVAS